MLKVLFTVFLSALVIISNNEAFNIESTHYTVYRGVDNSMFGYSVAEYRDQNHRGWVIVGAPNNQTSQIGVERGGAVYRCDINDDNRCFSIDFDKKGSNNIKSKKGLKGLEPIDEKSHQLFGATLSTSMTDGGPLLACAPKYHWFGYIKSTLSVAGFKDAIGTCWLAHLANGTVNEYSPCRINETAGHHMQGMCQAGMGAALTKDGKRVFIGAPGSWYWQGQLFSVDTNVSLPFIPFKEAHPKHNTASAYVEIISTKEGPAYEDNSYLGYSVVVGDFKGNGDSGVAVGTPRGADLHGKVLLFTSQLRNHQNITGEQMGAYFGYALAVNDIDGDDRDDLIVTAPFFTLPGDKIETGRIYVFYQGSGATSFQKFDTRDGENNRGQFGLSVASLGDIDLDGYGDFVVGEPYGGPENRGAVYIYHGSKDGVEEKPSQVIYSEQLEQPVRTFGWSVSGGMDLDNNHYTDMVVGAYESNTAAFFRARPVIKMISDLNFLSSSINLKNKACVLSDGTAVACSELKVCCMYTGLGAWNQHDFVLQIALDDKKKNNPRIYYLDYENKNFLNWTVTMRKDEYFCKQMKVYVSQHLRDKLTTLDAQMQVELAPDGNHGWRRRDPQRKLTAVLGPKNTKKRASLAIQKNCGSDNVCIPDLSLRVVKNVDKYLLGSEKIVQLDVTIQNHGEDAFESVFQMQLPPGIDYINIESQVDSKEVIIQCNAPKTNNNNTLKCDVGNPLPEGKLVKFKVFLQPITFHGMSPVYDIDMMVNSTNPERAYTMRNNIFNVTLPVWVETDIFIEGESKPQEIDFNLNDITNNEVAATVNNLEFGPVLTHNYTIRNNGPSSVLELVTSLIWTAETFSGDILLYLIEQPDVSDDKLVQCESANADYLSFKAVGKHKAKSDSQKTRYSRDVLDQIPLNQILEKEDEAAIFRSEYLCQTAQCVSLQCKVGPLRKDEEVSIAAKYRANVNAMKKTNETEKIRVSTKMLSVVTAQPFIGKPTDRVMRSYEVSTVIIPMKPINPPESIPLWIIILSALMGILLLLLLIYLLHMCGFFKRHRPSSSPESQPLNRNG